MRNAGYFFSKVSILKEDVGDNKLNLIIDIKLGKKAKIKKISFIGDKIYKNRKLNSVIVSEEYVILLSCSCCLAIVINCCCSSISNISVGIFLQLLV